MKRLLCSLFAAAALAVAGHLACPPAASAMPTPPEFTKNGNMHNEALEFLKKSDYGKVVEIETRLIGKDPGDLTARYILAIAYLGLDKERDALMQAQSARKADPAFASDIYGAMGRYFITKRRFHKALIYLHESLELKEEPAVMKHIATIYLGQGLLGNAKTYLERLLETEPDHLNLSRIYLAESEYDKAIKHAKKALEADSRATGAYLILGTAYLLTGRTDDAYTNFVILKQSNPEFFLTSYFLGVIKIIQKDYDAAVENFKSLNTQAPGIREGYLNAAVALHLKGELDKAAGMATKAIEQDPLDPVAHLAMANIKTSQKDFDGARAEYTKAADVFPDFGMPSFRPEEYFKEDREAARLSFAVILNRAGLYRQTRELAASSASSNPFVLTALARAEDKLGNKDSSQKTYIGILADHPGLSTPYAGLGELYDSMKKPALAAESYVKALKKTPAIKLKLKLADLYAASNETEKAAAEYRQAIEESPETVTPYWKLALILSEKKKDLEGALRYALKGASVNPEDHEMKDTLGLVYLRMGAYDKALDAYTGIIKNGATNPSAYYRLGLVYKKLDKTQEAIGAFEKALNINDEFPEASEAKKQLRELSGIG